MTLQTTFDFGFDVWKSKLLALLGFYEDYRARTKHFLPYLFLFFIGLNVACYWIAMITAFPERAFSSVWLRYFLIQFPVGLFGALFDFFSFFVTVFIVKRAISSKTKLSFLAHLSIDLVIAVLATMWVLIVFSISTWTVDTLAFDLGERRPVIVTKTTEVAQSTKSHVGGPKRPAPASRQQTKPRLQESYLKKRSAGYKRRLIDAIQEPFAPENLKNIYFGLLMGASAMLPSLAHIVMSMFAAFAVIQLWCRRK